MMPSPADAVILEVSEQIAGADRRYGPFASTHEAYGVLAEEVAELLAVIGATKLESIRLEAIQVAAVALRLAYHCRDHAAFEARSTK